jgi:predicted PurR-regulated permease PerM
MQAPERPTSGEMAMNYIEGFGLLLMNFIGPAILALMLAYGGYQTYLWRRRRGKPTGQYLLALGLPVLASFVLIAIVIITHLGRGAG